MIWQSSISILLKKIRFKKMTAFRLWKPVIDLVCLYSVPAVGEAVASAAESADGSAVSEESELML